ncbi:NADAR family protein [Pedobacter frigiditerrae]|uniref:NADAR family protein n=1 Tax=Pedobacter frigiditerrae TaxID=2530452 RepID=A0A4R0MPT0_9SPHI|nr:NADAR family protein [Pedobacter frigiditerrae]TCC88004.1 NADAR family protein [Pedobacter frigiditerrae]
MNYNLEKFIQENKAQKFLFFWGDGNPTTSRITKTCLSQWYLSPFTVDEITYQTAEHWMMAKKASLFNDEDTLAKILKAKSPAEAKKLGREVKNYSDELWLRNRYQIVKQGNYYKFIQHPKLKEFLQQTQKRVLVEASPNDTIWGIGLTHDHPNATIPEKWNGLNLLGFALMEVRDELIKTK